jgi:phosphinothricin acetyltransferase
MPRLTPRVSRTSAIPNNQLVSIRRATLEDIGVIADIWCDGVRGAHGLEPPERGQVLSFFRARLEDESIVYGIWVAEIEGTVTGFQSLQRSRPNPISKWAESSTYISAKFWNMGIGRALVAFAKEHATNVGFSHVVGFIRAGNNASIRIYESLGWKKVGSVPCSNPGDPEYFYYVNAI